MVAEHYASLGFTELQVTPEGARCGASSAADLFTKTLYSAEREAIVPQDNFHDWSCVASGSYILRRPSRGPEMLDRFSDANIYQTWAYGAVRWGAKGLSHISCESATAK